jgi:hypothetical protein
MSVHQLVGRATDQGVGIVYIEKRLCLPPETTIRSIVERIRKLIEKCDFPAPAAPRIWGGKVLEGADAVHAHARWHRQLVDAWFDNRTPPALRVVVDNAERNAAAGLLDARAAELAGGGMRA